MGTLYIGTIYRNPIYIGTIYRPCRQWKCHKWILQTNLYTQIWQLMWNVSRPQIIQTTHPIWIDNLNSSITIQEIEFVILKLPNKKLPDPDDFTREFYQMFKEGLTPILHNFLQKREEWRKLPYSFYEVSVTLILNIDEDSTKKTKTRDQYLSWIWT